MKEIQGYKIITLRMQQNVDSHVIYAKENSTRIKDLRKPNGKTLFLVNIPPYITEGNLRYGLRNVGEIVSILFYAKAGKNEDTELKTDKITSVKSFFTFKIAYVVFKSTKSLEKALQLEKIDLFDEEDKSVVKSGVEKWMEEYLNDIPDEDALQDEIDKYMSTYDKKEQEVIAAEKSTKADDEGWITVPKRGRNAGFKQNQSSLNKLGEKIEQSRKKKELTNFYTFQIRESKMQNIVSLRKRFEEDKKKIETLKKSRRFKPF